MTTAWLIIIFLSLTLIPAAVWMRYRWFLRVNGRRRDIPVTPKRFILSLYSLLLLTLIIYGIALPVTIALYLTVWNRERRLILFHRLINRSLGLMVKLLPGIDFTLNNEAGENFTRPAVIISNHQSHLDLLCLLLMNERIVVLTNRWVWRNPLYGWIIRLAEYYPVANGLEYNLPRLKSLTQRGYSIVIFPEGTRSPHCDILRFHTGAFYLAENLHLDILPVILHGPGHCIPKEDFMLRPGHMYLEIKPRIKIDGNGDQLYTRKITNRVRAQYIEWYDQLKKQRETATYFAGYVINKYRYLPGQRHCIKNIKRLLKENNCYSETVDRSYPPDSTVVVLDNTMGVVSWLMTLVHSDLNIISVIEDSRELALAQNTPGQSDYRLTFTDKRPQAELAHTIIKS